MVGIHRNPFFLARSTRDFVGDRISRSG